MADHQTLSAVFFLLLVPHAACMAMAKPSSSTLLQDKCELYAAGDRPSYDYCIRTLRADRASATDDERGLAAIAARIARATAVATGARSPGCSAARRRPPADGLAACAAEYAAAVRRLGAPRGRRVGSRGGPGEGDARGADAAGGGDWRAGALRRRVRGRRRTGVAAGRRGPRSSSTSWSGWPPTSCRRRGRRDVIWHA